MAALFGLRWRLLRTRRARVAGAIALAAAVSLLVLAALAGAALPRAHAFDFALVAPSAYVGFAVLCVVAQLAAGGGVDLFPADQLAVHPVRPATRFAVSVLLTPLNLAWFLQALVLVAVTTYAAGPGPLLALGLTTLAVYVALVTVLGQLVAGVLLRAWRARGGRVVLLAAVTTAGIAADRLGSDALLSVLDDSPTVRVVGTVVAGTAGHYRAWATATAVLAAALAAVTVAGSRLARWTDGGRPPTGRLDRGPLRRRDRRRLGPAAMLAAVDRAGVWRASALRRGVLVVALAPAAVTAVGRPAYPSLALLPGLVAAGAGLLYGVNAFALDAGGAMWLASLPVRPGVVFAAKARVVTEFCALPVLLTLAVGAVVARRPPTAGEATAVTAAAACSCACVVSACMKSSVRRPHHAEFRGSRDAPAPPGVMVVHSVRLAATTAGIGLLFAVLARAGSSPVASLVAAVGLLALAGRSLAGSARAWADDERRLHVVQTVARG